MPLTKVGSGIPATSRMVAADVDDVVELAAYLALWPRSPLGQWMMVPLRVPPKWEATCLVHW